MKKPEYHFCFIGPFDRNELDKIRPSGEGSIRRANQEAYRKLTNEAEVRCSSGWGVTPEQKTSASFFLNDDELKDALVQSYLDENLPLPTKAYKAWMILRESEGHKFRKQCQREESQ